MLISVFDDVWARVSLVPSPPTQLHVGYFAVHVVEDCRMPATDVSERKLTTDIKLWNAKVGQESRVNTSGVKKQLGN